LRELLAKYRDVETLLQVGDYQHGQDPVGDEAIEKIDDIRAFLGQRTDDLRPFDEIVNDLFGLAE
jgi:type III secretion protein N (ATPase)